MTTKQLAKIIKEICDILSSDETLEEDTRCKFARLAKQLEDEQ
jgi:hypothetical protein